MADNLDLASDYSPTRDQWLAAVDKVLKGKDFDRVLVSSTLDDLLIQPLYTSEDVATYHDEAGFPGFDPLLRGADAAPRVDGQWDIRTRNAHPEAKTANAQILNDLTNGATSVELVLDLGAWEGISVRSSDDLAAVLDGVLLDVAPVALQAGPHGVTAALWLLDVLAVRGISGVDAGRPRHRPGRCAGHRRAGPHRPRTSASLWPIRTPAASLHRLRRSGLRRRRERRPRRSATSWPSGVHYLRALIEAGVANPGAQIALVATADVDVFATVANLPALRHCWTTVLRAPSISPSTPPASSRSRPTAGSQRSTRG